MEEFREYFIILFTVSIICTISDLLADFASKGTASALKVINSMTVLITVFSFFFNGCDINGPLEKITKLTSETAATENIIKSESGFIKNTKSALEKNISDAVFEKSGIKPDDVSIEFNTESKENITEVSLQKIAVIFPSNTDEIQLNVIKSFIAGFFGTDTEIICSRSI